MLLWAVFVAAQQPEVAPTSAAVFVVRVEGAIGPSTAERVPRALRRAADQHAQLVVLQMDTPGGLDSAMRTIIQSILASPLPVAAFVAPPGARAASAGTYILYASHIAAMAPATNLGAATPIAIGMPSPGGAEPSASAPPNKGEHAALEVKRINDAAAYIRGLAQLRGRDAEWAELAVREAVSLPATEALQRHVIDLIASDVPQLMRVLDGREVRLGEGSASTVKLHTSQAVVVTLEPDWRDRLLAAISNPSLVLVLMMMGVYGLLFEFMNPGYIVPGVVGGVCLLLALWGMQMLPVNYAGLGLILLGLAFLVAEAFVPSYGALGMGGVAAFALGALLLIDSEAPGFGIPLSLIASLTAVTAVAVLGIVALAERARRRPVVAGPTQLVGAMAEVVEWRDGEGWATINGEHWRVRAREPLQTGQHVRVERVDGLTLEVAAHPLHVSGGG